MSETRVRRLFDEAIEGICLAAGSATTVTSGYLEHAMLADTVLKDGAIPLEKPFPVGELLGNGDIGRVREAIRATIEYTTVGADGTLTLGVKPQGLLGAQTAVAHSGRRGNGPIMERTIRSTTGRQ